MSPVLNTSRNLVADQIDDGLEVELGGHALLDAVDHRQLGGALLGFLEQALRLVEQARVLERDAHARGHRREQAHLGLAIGVFALVVLQVDRAEHAVTTEDRDLHRRLALVGAGRVPNPSAAMLGATVHDTADAFSP